METDGTNGDRALKPESNPETDVIRVVESRGFAWRFSIRWILLVGFLVACGAPIVGFWYWSYNAIIKHEEAEVRERHLLLARNLGHALDRYYDDLISAFDAFAAPMAAGGDAAFARDLFLKLQFRHICIFNIDDLRLSQSYLTKQNPCPDKAPPVRAKMFLDLIASSDGQTVMSGVAQTPDQATVIYLVKQIGNDMVIGAVTTEYFRELGGRINFGRQGHAAIVDQNGRVLAHPLESWEEAAKDISKVSAVARMLRGESGVQKFYSPALKGDMIAGFTAVKPAGWGVMVPQPVKELEEAAASVLQSALIILLIGLGFAGVLAVIIANRFATSIRLVADTAHRMSGGEIDARVETRHDGLLFDEFADLGETFNDMAESMQQARIRETNLRIKAEQATVAKSQFLAMMSHEIRTPMNGVLGLGALLRTTNLDEKQQLYTERLMESGSALMGVLNDILDYSQIEAGRMHIEASPFDLPTVVKSVVDLMSAEPETRGVAVELDIAPGVSTILGDEQRTRQVLLNLVGNAVKFTEKGVISISVKPEQDDGFVRLSVKDTGVGIPLESQDAIFGDFMQADQSQSRSQGGSGLGLAICKRLSVALGGDIGFTSEPGVGTEFWFTLPVSGPPDPEAAP